MTLLTAISRNDQNQNSCLRPVNSDPLLNHRAKPNPRSEPVSDIQAIFCCLFRGNQTLERIYSLRRDLISQASMFTSFSRHFDCRKNYFLTGTMWHCLWLRYVSHSGNDTNAVKDIPDLCRDSIKSIKKWRQMFYQDSLFSLAPILGALIIR